MLKPLKIPRGIANIFRIGNSTEIKIPEKWAYRPDQILESVGSESMKGELANNYLSVKSPISLSKGTPYVIADSLFEGYFVNGKR
ncbi:MAG: hypothetical protein IKS48_07360 [Eubacterium sp.]|nr:hypothetical protein [Methanobrevibacter sp.]MBR6403186.1 hypothetical protein [Eubacterium sp.]